MAPPTQYSKVAIHKTRFRPTLNFIFAVTVCGLALMLLLLFVLFFNGSRNSIIDSADRLRDLASKQIETRIERFFERAQDSLTVIEQQIDSRTLIYSQPADLERALFTELSNNPEIAEISFTYATKKAWDAEGGMEIETAGRGELSLLRLFEPTGSRILTRHVRLTDGKFISEIRNRATDGQFASTPFIRESGNPPVDPTEKLTFKTTVQKNIFGNTIWSDLHFAPQSRGEKIDSRSVRVSVQRAISNAGGQFLGVLRTELSTDELDRIVSSGLRGDGKPEEHRILLCDKDGRLVTRLTHDDILHEYQDAFRFLPKDLPADVAAALKLDALHTVNKSDIAVEKGSFLINGQRYLVTFRALQSTQDWIVAIVVPESAYLQGLLEARTRLLVYSLAVMICILAGGIVTIRIVKRDLSEIERETGRMRNFEFNASHAEPLIEDVHQVMDRLELAKTAMRSMSKYVPVALVRKLYEMRAEPVLGSESCDVSIMFTDIKDFTTLSEQLTPDELAHALGRYLQTMTDAIQVRKGTIDKFIGDAVMTLWNVPVPVANHAHLACTAALDCKTALDRLFSFPEWNGLPKFETRFGLHKDQVMVGHFGAPDRMSYTAMGDGVNVASRLEGLNKLYGTSILVSETIRNDAGSGFAFRLVDIVAVKGRKKGLKVFELISHSSEASTEVARIYERAFELYLGRHFDAAVAILMAQSNDNPSAVLIERCRMMQSEPPSADWDGIYFAKTK